MSAGWTQVTGNRWRKTVQTSYGLLTAEITGARPGGIYSVHVQGPMANQGLTLPFIDSFEEAQEVGDALLVQFRDEPPPTMEFTMTPYDPSQ